MSTSYEDGEIYYDNMEIMENIQKMKNARTMKEKPPLPSQPPPPPVSVNEPPKLPPKKKNLSKPPPTKSLKAPIKPALVKNNSSGSAQKGHLNLNSSQIRKETPASRIKFHSQPASNASGTQKPSFLNLNSKPNQPPISATNHQVKPKNNVVQPVSTVETPANSNIPQSPHPKSTPQVWSHPSSLRTRSIVEEPLAPIVEEDAISEVSPRSSLIETQVSRHSEDEQYRFESAESTDVENSVPKQIPIQEICTKRPNELRVPKSNDLDHGLNKSPVTHGNEADKGSPALDEEGLVRPYGMVDVQWMEDSHEIQKDPRVPGTKLKSPLPDVVARRFAKSPSVERNGHLDSPSSPARSSPADFGHSSEDSGSGVCAYMSIPIQMETGNPENAPRQHKPSSRLRTVPKANNDRDKYKEDEYIYDEIQDYNKDVANCDDAMQKALDDINEVLQSMNIEGITAPAPTPKARRFPVVNEKENGEGAEYDNFLCREDTSISPKLTSPATTKGKISSPRQEMALPTPPEPPPSQIRQQTAYQKHDTQIRDPQFSNGPVQLLGDDRNRRGRLSSEESEPKEKRTIAYKKGSGQDSQLNVLSKSRESIAKKEGESGSSRRTSRGELEESSEADSCSVNGKQSDTTSGIVKSTGNSTSSQENLRGSTKSLGRSNSFDRKKSSSFRSKFRFRVRSKSQERFGGDSDSLGHMSGVSDAEEKNKGPRQRGSRLRRRLSRKRMENRESADSKSVEEFKVDSEDRSSTSVSFIRKLLRKSKQNSNERPMSYGKPVIATPADVGEQVVNKTSSNQSQPEPARDKQMVSPPSRRARKMLHPRSARDKAMSDSSNSDMDGDYRRKTTNETLKQKDEYLEPCDPSDARTGDPTKERGRRMNHHRSKQNRDKQPESAMSTLHREKYKALVSLNAQTLKKITEKWLKEWRNKLPVGGFLITSWADIVIASNHPQCTVGRTVIYESYFATNPDHRLACQIFDRRDVNDRLIAQLENCSTLTAHPNLCSVCSHFYCKVPGSLMHPPREENHTEALCVVLSNVPAASLATYISRLREVKEQKQKHKQILLMLLQLLQAMDNLSRSGFTPSNINIDNLIVTQDMGLLQVMPHMDVLDYPVNGQRRPVRTMVSQFSGVLSWTLQMALDSGAISTPSFPLYSYLSAILRISRAIVNSSEEFEVVSLQRLVQCALWGPKSAAEITDSHEDIYDTLASWIEVKQAELVSDIAVLFSAKSDVFPIYLFYKHEYFSRIDPRTLFQNLRVLGRI